MRIFSFILLALWVLADQALKLYTLNTFEFQQPAETVIPGVLALTYTLNKGAAWSLFWGQLGFLTVLRFTVAVMITLYLFRKSVTGWPRIAFAMIAAGAFGNAIDGLHREGVVDMLILWPLTTVYRAIAGTDFPIFNVADIGVVGGALLLVLLSFIAPKQVEPEARTVGQVQGEDEVAFYPPRATALGEADVNEAGFNQTDLDQINLDETPFDPTADVKVYPDPRLSNPDLPEPGLPSTQVPNSDAPSTQADPKPTINLPSKE